MVDQNLCPGLIFQTFCIHPSYLLPHLCGRYFIYSLPHPVKGRTEGSLASSPQIIRPATVQQDPQLLYLRKVPIQLHILDLRSNNYFCTYGSMELHDTQHMDPSWSNFINFLTCLNLSPGRLGAYTLPSTLHHRNTLYTIFPAYSYVGDKIFLSPVINPCRLHYRNRQETAIMNALLTEIRKTEHIEKREY